jgi:hypothetical protein
MDSLPNTVPVTPKPRLPRLIGSLNIVFGFCLFLRGLDLLSAVGPSFAQNEPFKLERGDAQNLYDQLRRRQIVELETLEQSTKDESKKASFREVRRDLEANHESNIDRKLDLKEINRVLLWIHWYFWTDFATGPVLNLFMLASGIGLTQLRVWARRMALWVAALKIVRIVALTLVFTLFIVPQARRVIDTIVPTELGRVIVTREHVNQLQSSLGPPLFGITAENYGIFMSVVASAVAILIMFVSLVYPVVTLIVLNRPGAKAACCLEEVSGTEEHEGEWS